MVTGKIGSGDALQVGWVSLLFFSFVSFNPHHPSPSLPHTLYLPKFGFNFPARIFSAVDLPIPLVPTSPRTSPGRGIGRRCNLNEFALYRWVVSFSRLLGRLMIEIASKGHFFRNIQKGKIWFFSRPRPLLPLHRSRSRYIALLKLQPSCQRVLPLYTAFLKRATHSNAFVSVHPRCVNIPILTTGQDRLHSWRHFLGLQRSWFTMAILVSLS